MSEQSDNNNGNGTALGASIVASAVAGVVGSSLFGHKETRTERVQRQIDERVRRLESRANDSLSTLSSTLDKIKASGVVDTKNSRKRVHKVNKDASRAADSALKTARDRIRELDRESLRLQSIERANKLGSQGSAYANELATVLGSHTATLINDTRSSVPQWKSRAAQSVFDAREKGATLLSQATNPVPDARDRAAASASNAGATVGQLIEEARKRVPDMKDATSSKAQEVSDAARTRLGSVTEIARGKARGTTLAARDKARETADRARATSPGVSETAASLAASATSAAHDAADRLRQKSPAVADRVSTLSAAASDFAGTAQERAPALVESVKSVVHTAQDHAPGALESVKDALHTAQEKVQSRLDDQSSTAHKLVDQARDLSRHAVDDLLPGVQQNAATVAEKAQARTESARSNLSSVSASASDKLSHTTTVVPQKSRAVATAAGRGSKDAGSLVLWASAAAGVAFYAFLNEGQRAKVKESAGRVVAEIRDVYQDMRGMDGDFN